MIQFPKERNRERESHEKRDMWIIEKEREGEKEGKQGNIHG